MAIRQITLRPCKLARTCALVALASALSGCLSSAQVESKQLPVRRVVVYRNGVAYFERGGRVNADHVQFQLRKENIGDFLATLAVLERGGQSVRSASFPVSLEQDGEEMDPELSAAMDRWDGKKKRTRELRRVTLELGKGEHDLSVGYLAETPLWRPSYRLVVGQSGRATLQAWGIVQNQSGEDWKDVEVALVAGAPIAFESTLAEPVIPPRPVVRDDGEAIAYVPEGETTYERPAPSKPLGPNAGSSADMKRRGLGAGAGGVAPATEEAMQDEASAAEPEMMAPAPASPPVAAADLPAYSLSPRDVSGLARVQAQTGATRYEVPHRVTIPDKSATMVLLVNQEVSGEAVYLYSPDGGVPDSYVHPFRVARFKNESGGLLERGPIAVFEKGAFLGQGIMESLPDGGGATVPFALVRSLTLHKEVSQDQRNARLYSIEMGELTIERDQVTIFAYHVENGDKSKARVLIKHQLSPGAELWDPPQGTEKLAGDREVLSPVDIPPSGAADLMLEERQAFRRRVEFRSAEARTAVRDYLKAENVPQKEREILELILKHAAQLQALDDQETALTREQRELEKGTQESRRSLQAIKDNQQAAALRRELTDRLALSTRRLDELTKELVEVRLRRTEQELRLRDAKQGISIPPPDRRK